MKLDAIKCTYNFQTHLILN